LEGDSIEEYFRGKRCWSVETPDLKVDHTSIMKGHCGARSVTLGEVLQRKKDLECLKLLRRSPSKWITVVDHEGMCGARSVTLGMEYFGGKRIWSV
jgi:hypothetical protein